MHSSSGYGSWRYLAMTTRYPLSHSLTAVYRSNEYGRFEANDPISVGKDAEGCIASQSGNLIHVIKFLSLLLYHGEYLGATITFQ